LKKLHPSDLVDTTNGFMYTSARGKTTTMTRDYSPITFDGCNGMLPNL